MRARHVGVINRVGLFTRPASECSVTSVLVRYKGSQAALQGARCGAGSDTLLHGSWTCSEQ